MTRRIYQPKNLASAAPGAASSWESAVFPSSDPEVGVPVKLGRLRNGEPMTLYCALNRRYLASKVHH